MSQRNAVSSAGEKNQAKLPFKQDANLKHVL